MLESKVDDIESFKSCFFEPCVLLILILIGAFVKCRLQQVLEVFLRHLGKRINTFYSKELRKRTERKLIS